ncbi:MAG: DinB family protein [Ilumatobacteraceae bacterium]
MPIVPDDKNWTWVLERPCPDCGFVAQELDLVRVPAVLRANAVDFAALLSHPRVTERPDDGTWSGLEYGCHVRDVYRLYLFRLDLMRGEDAPQFPNWDQDVTALDDRYHEQSAVEVAGELAVAADLLARAYETIEPHEWSRTGFRSDGAAFTIESFTRYLVHDPVHHVWDVQRGYERLARG